MPRKRNLSDRRSTIRELWHNGLKKPAEIVRKTGFPKSTVYDLVKKLKETGSTSPRPRSGRPQIITSNKRQYLGRLIHSYNAVSAPEMTEKLKNIDPTLEVTTRTVQQTVKQRLHYVVCCPIPVPLLHPRHIEA